MSDTIYSFDTANLSIRAYAEPEECDPAEHFDFPDMVAAVENGEVAWFCAVVEIKHRSTGAALGGDCLGCCSYNSADEFVAGHRDPDPMNRNCSVYRAKQPGSVICHYFPDLIRQACREARGTLRQLRDLPVRENA